MYSAKPVRPVIFQLALHSCLAAVQYPAYRFSQKHTSTEAVRSNARPKDGPQIFNYECVTQIH